MSGDERFFPPEKDFKHKISEEDFNKKFKGFYRFNMQTLKLMPISECEKEIELPVKDRTKIFTKSIERMESYRKKYIEKEIKKLPGEIKRET